MKQTSYKKYENRQPCGAVALSNCFGLLVYEPTEGDGADADYITAWSTVGSKNWGFRKNKVYYTSTGRAFLRKGSQRFFLDEIIRI